MDIQVLGVHLEFWGYRESLGNDIWIESEFMLFAPKSRTEQQAAHNLSHIACENALSFSDSWVTESFAFSFQVF